MKNRTVLEKLLMGIDSALSTGPVKDVKSNIEALIRSNLEKLDFVSREQFDIQVKIVERTRARVNALEEQVKALENRLSNQGQDAD